MFANLLEGLTSNLIVLYDLLLEYRNNVFQIDSLLISRKQVYLFEVKNLEGDFFIESDIWYAASKKEVKNPILQLNRAESMLRQLLQEYGINLPVKGQVIFINPEFSLYQAPLDLPIVFPTQLNRLLRQLNMVSTKPEKSHFRLAETLIRNHSDKSPYDRIPEYDYSMLKKGIPCGTCNSLQTILDGNRIRCKKCGYAEAADSAVVKNVKRFQLLFPNEKITTNRICDWCGIINSTRTIRRILGKHFAIKGHGKYSYYIDP